MLCSRFAAVRWVCLALFCLSPVFTHGSALEVKPITVIDVMMVWTPAVQAQSHIPLPDFALDLIEQANAVLLNSRAQTQLSLIHAGKVSYAEEFQPNLRVSHETTLERLVRADDGHLDEVHQLRDQQAADLVVLLVEWGTGAEGFATVPQATVERAFGVMGRGTDPLGLARLVGRLLGCEAQRGPVEQVGFVTQAGVFQDSHGLVVTNDTGYQMFSSIMASGGLRLPVFSNPEVSCYGRPIGVAGLADNVRTIKLRAPEVAAFRAPVRTVQPVAAAWNQPANGAVFSAGADVSLELVTTADENVARVEVFQTDPQTGLIAPWQKSLTNLVRPPFRFVLPRASPNWHRLVARIRDRQGFASVAEVQFRVREDNDDFAARRALSLPHRAASRFAGMTVEPGEQRLWGAEVAASGWWTWTAPDEGTLKVDWRGGPAVTLQAFTGTDLEGLSPKGVTSLNPHSLLIPVQNNEAVQLAAGATWAEPHWLAGELAAGFFPPLINDEFADRITLSGSPVVIAGHNVGAWGDTNAVWPEPGGPCVWWTWVPPATGVARLQSRQPAPGHYFWMFSGTTPETLVPVFSGQLDNPLPGFAVQEGEPIQIGVLSNHGDSGGFEFSLELLPAVPNGEFAARERLSGRGWTNSLVFPSQPVEQRPPGLSAHCAWWEWTAPESGAVILWAGLNGSRVAVFTGDSLDSLQPTAEPAYGGVAFTAAAGTTYQVALSWEQIPGPLAGQDFRLLYLEANDAFAQPVALAGAPVTWTLPDRWGTLEPEETHGLWGSRWFSWRAPVRGRATITTVAGPGFPPRVAVFRGESLAELTTVLAVAEANRASFLVEPGVVYRLAIEAVPFDNGGGGSVLVPTTLRIEVTPPPSNDSFASRPGLHGRQHSLIADTSLATAQAGEPQIPWLAENAGTVWWQWTAPDSGVATFAATSGALGIYRREANGTLTTLGYAYPNWIPLILGVNAGDRLELMLAGSQPAAAYLDLQPRWPNDSFAGRTPLTPVAWQPGNLLFQDAASSQGALREPTDPELTARTTGHTRWWTWQTAVPAVANLVVVSDAQVFAEQFRLSPSGNLQRVVWGQTNGYVILRFHAEPGVEYPLVVDGVNGQDAYYTVHLTLTPDAPAPGNDVFAQAQPLAGQHARVIASQRNATAEAGEPAHVGQPAARSQWWRWTAPETGIVTVRARASSTVYAPQPEHYPPGVLATPSRPRLAVYQGTSLPSLTAIGDRLSNVSPLESSVRFVAESGVTYHFAVDTGDPARAEVGEFSLELTQPPGNNLQWSARELTGEKGRITGTLAGITLEAPNFARAWWRWMAPRNLQVTLRNRNPQIHNWSVYRGETSAVLVTSHARHPSNPNLALDFTAQTGETYYISVDGNPADPTSLDLELEGIPFPANDAFANRTSLTSEPVRVSQRAELASREANEPPHGLRTVWLPEQFADAPSLWWSWTAPRSGRFVVTTAIQHDLLPAETDPWTHVVRADVFVYQGDQLAGLTRIAGTEPDVSTGGDFKRVFFHAEAEITYQIAVCPLIRELRLSDELKYFTHLAIDPAPANDTDQTAILLSGSTVSAQGNLRTAPGGLWWKWTAPGEGYVVLGSRFDALPSPWQLQLAAWARNETGGNLVSANPELGPAPWFYAAAGQTYWLSASLRWNLNLDYSLVQGHELPVEFSLNYVRRAADNDAFAWREHLPDKVPVLYGDHTGATRESGEPLHGGALGQGSLWWEWTAPSSGRWRLVPQTVGWPFPLLVGIYRGISLDSLTPVKTARNATRGEVVFDSQAGETFVLAVDNPNAGTGTFRFDLVPDSPPANDNFAFAAPLEGLSPGWTASNVGATREANEPAHAGAGVPQASAWWSWQAPLSSPVLLNFNGVTVAGPPGVSVYQGDSLENLERVADNAAGGGRASHLVFAAMAGKTYRIALDTPAADAGLFQFQLMPTNAAANDLFRDSALLSGSRVEVIAFNTAATLEPDEPNPLGPLADATLWWSWTAPASGWVSVDTVGSEFDTRLAVFQGDRVSELALVALNDDESAWTAIPLSSSRVRFAAQAGTNYHLQLGTVSGVRGLIRFTLIGPEVPPPALIAAEPTRDVEFGRLRLRGTPGQTVWIQSSDDLSNWDWAGSLRFEREDAVWRDVSYELQAARFYRLVWVP